MSAPFIPVVYEQYRTEEYGPWHTRECYSWEYDAKAQECINTVNQSVWSYYGPSRREESEVQWFLQQAKIWQDRATYIRQKWAEQEARQEWIKQEASRIYKEVMESFEQATPPRPEQQEVTQLATSPNKKKLRNEKTRQQYKRRTLQANAENIAEKPTASRSNTVNTSLLSAVPQQASKQFDREPPHCSSKVHGCTSFRLRFLTEPCHCTALTSRLTSLPGYMEYAKEVEATGQG